MPHKIDKQAVADSFSKAAHHYDQFAQLQRDIGSTLFAQLNADTPSQIVDMGCGTGYFSKKLAEQFPTASITCFDLSQAMLNEAKNRHITNAHYQLGDIDYLPFEHNSLDLIFSNLAVQWSEDLSQCLLQIKNSLKKGGKCYITTLLDGTLEELKQAWKIVDNNSHTNRFLNLETVNDILAQCGFSRVELITESRTLKYNNVIDVMRALKGIGANHVHGQRTKKISGRKLLNQLATGYQPFIDEKGKLNLTYQVCYIEVSK